MRFPSTHQTCINTGRGRGARKYIILSAQCFASEGDEGMGKSAAQVSLPRAGHSWAALARWQSTHHRRRLHVRSGQLTPAVVWLVDTSRSRCSEAVAL